MNESEKLDTMNFSKSDRKIEITETPEITKTPEVKEKTKKYIKDKLLESVAFGGVSVISFFLWLIKKCGDKVKKDAMSGIKGSLKAFESINKSH